MTKEKKEKGKLEGCLVLELYTYNSNVIVIMNREFKP